jgi:hypothetical protein
MAEYSGTTSSKKVFPTIKGNSPLRHEFVSKLSRSFVS